MYTGLRRVFNAFCGVFLSCYSITEIYTDQLFKDSFTKLYCVISKYLQGFNWLEQHGLHNLKKPKYCLIKTQSLLN